MLRKKERYSGGRVKRVKPEHPRQDGAVAQVLVVCKHRRDRGGGLLTLLNKRVAEVFVERRVNDERPEYGEPERGLHIVALHVGKKSDERLPRARAGGKCGEPHLSLRHIEPLHDRRCDELLAREIRQIKEVLLVKW